MNIEISSLCKKILPLIDFQPIRIRDEGGWTFLKRDTHYSIILIDCLPKSTEVNKFIIYYNYSLVKSDIHWLDKVKLEQDRRSRIQLIQTEL